ncbi:MAG: aminopeptidase P N-terminal domain-containing protein [Clostridia bacterium]|nr:aminopeptidase P N-terminal domain-containing protein [Clostridia bacterium]
MDRSFHAQNRARLYEMMKLNSLLVIFSGEEIRKTNDEYYPFFADRNFFYLTGLEGKNFILMAAKDTAGKCDERIYILPPDLMAERWTGRRIKPDEAENLSGIADVRFVDGFEKDFHFLASNGQYESVYLDMYKVSLKDIDRPAHHMKRLIQNEYPYLHIENANPMIRRLRTIKLPCEIEATRTAVRITGEGILAMMKASRPGMYEYQYKAEFDHVLGQYGPQMAGFPPIISAGKNNFCIHYYDYTGRAEDGDMVLNDVGAIYDGHINDVSRGWPVNGRFTDRQKLLYECALATSDYMFSIIRPGMKMKDVDATIRQYNAERMVDVGVMKTVDEVGKYMWHGGAHHIGYDVHDVIETPEIIAPNMMFCVDVGIYHEEWGIGFRLEDNCLVTEQGCENLSAGIPRTIYDIESVMKKR